MMGKLTPLPTIGAGDLTSITEFLGYLNDPDKYKERIEALDKQRREINELIETVGKVKEIERLRAETIQKNEESKKILEAALEKRKSVDEKIEEDLAECAVKIRKKMDEANGLFNDRERTLVNGERQLKKDLDDYNKKNQELTARESRARESIEKAEAALARYQKACSELRDAIEASAKAL